MSDEQHHLTTRQGHPIYDNQHQRTVGSRGPATLENYHFLEKISHFDRERIAERVVHARGFVAQRVVAVGTTVVRALETMRDAKGCVYAGEGWTCAIVTSSRGIREVTGPLTGLHEPRHPFGHD